jgi:hypothetical protein
MGGKKGIRDIVRPRKNEGWLMDIRSKRKMCGMEERVKGSPYANATKTEESFRA